MKRLQTQVLVIGGGVTGTGLARDLALRGVQGIVVERRDINSGASGANHGLLHSGARYLSVDPEAARECALENERIRQLAPQCVEETGGLFVAVEGDDEAPIADFPQMCRTCGIPFEQIDPAEALELEPELSKRCIAAFRVQDAAVDPFRLSLENIRQAEEHGTRLLLHSQVTGMEVSGARIRSVRVRNEMTGEQCLIEPEQVVNASGAWAAQIAAMVGIDIPMIFSKGSLLITDTRLTQHVINRLRPSSDADILVPGGTVSIVGTTSIRILSLEDIRPTVPEIDLIVEVASQMVPALASARYIRAYAGVRPLVGSRQAEDRSISRSFTLIDHERDRIENFVSITGGKLTTYRLMAEKTADAVCGKLGVDRPCLTRTQRLPEHPDCQWTEAGLSPRLWMHHHRSGDALLCECEMVPKSVVDSITEALKAHGHPVELRAIGLRSRIGKGLCQGAFCALRIAAHLYERGILQGEEGVAQVRNFLRGRWKGIRPVLWGTALAQEELQEAVHCGLFGLELPYDES